jgi:DNA-binding transcriptional LysR family regulator
MELRHLRYFIAVAEEENVSRAALKLHVSQPALSRQVRDLEEELGFALLERSAKSVKLTAAGRAFLAEAQAVLVRLEQGLQAARAVASGGHGELHVGYAPSPTARLLPPTLRAFQAELPHVRVRLHDLSTEEMLAGLRTGQLQLALMVQQPPALMRGLRFVPLTTDVIRLAVAPNHPLAQKRAVTLADIAALPLVAYGRREYPDYYALLEALFAGVKNKPRVVEEHDGVTSIIAAVEAGAGVALLSESVACMAGPRLKLLPLTPAVKPAIIGAAFPNTPMPPVAEHFLKCAQSVATAR